jgi:hypothetical protein
MLRFLARVLSGVHSMSSINVRCAAADKRAAFASNRRIEIGFSIR